MAIVTQHPFGTLIVAKDATLKYSSTAAGVTIALLDAILSPEIATAILIAPTVSPVGTAHFVVDIVDMSVVAYKN